MSRILTNDMRDKIVTNVLKATFDERNQVHKQQGHDIALAFYTDVFGAKMIADMNAIPNGWLPTVQKFSIKVAGEWAEIHLAEFMRVPATKTGGCWAVYEATHELVDLYAAWKNAEDDLKKQKGELKVKVRALLDSVTTIKKLLEAWPEAVDYLPPPPAPTAVPAIRADELNATIQQLKAVA